MKEKKQNVILNQPEDIDIINFYKSQDYLAFNRLIIRKGKLLGRDDFISNRNLNSDEEALTSFLLQYYEKRNIPEQILTPVTNKP